MQLVRYSPANIINVVVLVAGNSISSQYADASLQLILKMIFNFSVAFFYCCSIFIVSLFFIWDVLYTQSTVPEWIS